ncbi:MAG: integration host factor subunit beta [Planctomycetes bacterium]|nr:integration host factor subunit beta [Planctomycetota bacterium]
MTNNKNIKTTTKRDLVQRISDSSGQTKVLVRDIIQAFLEEVGNELVAGNRLEFRKFGVFEVRNRPGRIAQNPKSLEKVVVPAKRVVKFKVGNVLKKQVEAIAPQSDSDANHAAAPESNLPPQF